MGLTEDDTEEGIPLPCFALLFFFFCSLLFCFLILCCILVFHSPIFFSVLQLISPDRLYVLAITYIISLLHIVFSFLAFKNEVPKHNFFLLIYLFLDFLIIFILINLFLSCRLDFGEESRIQGVYLVVQLLEELFRLSLFSYF